MMSALISIFLLLATIVKSQRKADSLAIWAIIEQQVTSWNSGDATSYSAHFSAHGMFTNIRGMFFNGHKQFLNQHIDLFKGMFSKTVLHRK